MGWIGSKLICFFMELLCFVIQTANLFLANIVIYEASTGVSFDFGALLNNYVFWIIVIIQIIYFIASYTIRSTNRKTDDEVERAIQNGSIMLVNQVVGYSEKGDFVSANKVLKLLKKIQKERR